MTDDTSDEDLEALPEGEYGFLPLDKVAFGPGSVERLPGEVEILGSKRVCLITTTSLTRTPLVGQVEALLGHRWATTFSGVKQHAPSETVLACIRAIEDSEADLLVTLGGGSAIDTAKASVLAIARDAGHFLPHIALPTTLSAAEFSPIFGVTDEKTKSKTGGNSPFVTPRVVLLDANLTAYTPDWLWLATGARAMDHAVETVYAPNHQPATDAPALEAVRLLFAHLPTSVEESPVRQAARQQCQIAAWLSFFGVANITLGLSHALGRELGPRYDIPHGYMSAVLLPKVMAYLLPATLERQALIARAAGVEGGGRAESEMALEAPTAVFSLFHRLGLPQRLRDLNVPEEDLPDLAAGRQDVLHILREAW